MIKINITLFPQGLGLLRQDNGHVQIWTRPDNSHHDYVLTAPGMPDVCGSIPKTKSAHRNIYSVLADVLNDAQPQLRTFGRDYITTGLD